MSNQQNKKNKRVVTLGDWHEECGIDLRGNDPNMTIADWMEQRGFHSGARVYRKLVGG